MKSLDLLLIAGALAMLAGVAFFDWRAGLIVGGMLAMAFALIAGSNNVTD